MAMSCGTLCTAEVVDVMSMEELDILKAGRLWG